MLSELPFCPDQGRGALVAARRLLADKGLVSEGTQ